MDRAVRGITDEDRAVFLSLVTTNLTEEQVRMVLTPNTIRPRQKDVLAIHWHPEWVPLDLVARRIAAGFPFCQHSLIIPTQHNELMVMGNYAGVEVDCYATGFNRKIQLLLHFSAARVAKAGVIKSMLEHTFKYRVGQLFEIMDSITNSEYNERMEAAVSETGSNEEVAAMARFYTARLRQLIMDNQSTTPMQMIKNRLIPDFLRAQSKHHPKSLIKRAVMLVQSVKQIVKRYFSMAYFFRVNEVIEETRYLGGGVVIPHPEQFWPVLLADYDVDGYEVWNPESREYTEFLIGALNRQNRLRGPGRRSLLIFMGDDTHMSVKVRDPETQEPSKLEREIGFQPAWDDVAVQRSLSLAGASRTQIIERYKERLG
ncbi:MAG: hypothetical protein HQK55_18600 [Deltaproteobacteria bacterium]|nr:hypothetical protein [Deltaproteobacteria bacterium]